MLSKASLLRPLALAALCAATTTSHAEFVVYTTQASFLAAVTQAGVDTFADISVTESTPSPLSRTAGAHAYLASATEGFFGANVETDPWLSTNAAYDQIVFSNFGVGVSAFGGNFFTSDISGMPAAGSVTLRVTDSQGMSFLHGSTGGFVGFVSTGGSLASVVLSSIWQGNPGLWPTADNVTLATAVPEPTTTVLLLGGLAWLALRSRRGQGD